MGLVSLKSTGLFRIHLSISRTKDKARDLLNVSGCHVWRLLMERMPLPPKAGDTVGKIMPGGVITLFNSSFKMLRN